MRMPNKIKIVMAGLAMIAIFSVYELSRFLHTLANNGPKLTANSSFTENNPDDPDHDGLSNQDEVLWGTDPFNPDTDSDGFKDGEEVASGHNPLIPGPDDLIKDENLTKKLSELTVSGLSSGDLKPDSNNYAKSLADITSSVEDTGKYAFSRKVDPATIKGVENNITNNTNYLKSLSPLLKQFGQSLADQINNFDNNLNIIGGTGFTDPITINFFNTQKDTNEKILNEGLLIRTPEILRKDQADFLTLAQQMRDINDSIANGQNDPLKAALALDALGNMIDNYISVIQQFQTDLKSLKIDESKL
jgi:hypothetical protein